MPRTDLLVALAEEFHRVVTLSHGVCGLLPALQSPMLEDG
jgi:hypothetical protein